MDLVQNFETTRVVAYLQALNLQELVHSPYFLGGTAALAIIALFMRWRMLLVTVLCLGSFAWLLSYTLGKDTSLQGGGGNDTLVVFVLGGGVIVFLAIYLLFIRGE
jgi:peptidoglycan/LPS O-acetylase OafA/YrhL